MSGIGKKSTSAAAQAPILVTGSHRSGTTWVGRTLAEADNVFYVPEPFNPRQDWFPTLARKRPIRRWFTYVYEENEAEYRGFLDEVQGLRIPPFGQLLSARSLGNPVTAAQQFAFSLRNRVRPRRPLLKDPIAFFSAEWIARTYASQVVVTIRHPAAFVNSVLQLKYRLDFKDLVEQPRLIADLVPEFEEQIREYAKGEPSPVEGASLEWVVIHHVIRKYQERHPDWLFVRHEDLSRNPVPGFEELYAKLGLDFTEPIKAYVAEHTRAGNPVDTRDHLAVKRDSRANVQKWKEKLDRDTVKHIRECVEPLASEYYSDEDW
jgi:hypothetical protein